MVTSDKKVYLMVASQLSGLKRQDWLDQMPELGIIADVEPVFLFEKPSADIGPEIWIKLAAEIHQRLDKASGFVVLHGIDNLLYTSSALSFLLQNLNKPIIFTGTQSIKPEAKKTEIRANLINASQAATYALPEVCLMFGNRLIRANQANRTNEESLNVFIAPPDSVLGRIDFSIRIFDKAVLKSKGKTKLYDSLSDKVEIIGIHPVLNLKALARRLADKEGIVINADSYQDLPADLMFLLEKITPDTPVIIWSRRIADTALAPKNILLINNLTWQAAITKFMWALTQSKNINKIKELMAKDIAGEILN